MESDTNRSWPAFAATVANEGGAAFRRRRRAFISATLSKYLSANYLFVRNERCRYVLAVDLERQGLLLGTGTRSYRTICKGSSRTRRRGRRCFWRNFTPLPRYSDTIIREYNAAIDELVAANGIWPPRRTFISISNNRGTRRRRVAPPAGHQPLRTRGRPSCHKRAERSGDRLAIGLINHIDYYR
jgi:hypothetical protein